MPCHFKVCRTGAMESPEMPRGPAPSPAASKKSFVKGAVRTQLLELMTGTYISLKLQKRDRLPVAEIDHGPEDHPFEFTIVARRL